MQVVQTPGLHPPKTKEERERQKENERERDQAAIALATVGIAMGAAGSDVALQAADVALLSEDMKKLADAHRLARRTAVIIRQNLVVAIGAMLLLITGGLFFDLPLPLAVIGHEGGTVLVVLNGLRLLSDRIRTLDGSVNRSRQFDLLTRTDVSLGSRATSTTAP